VKVGVSPNTLGGLSPLIPTKTLVPNKALNVYSLRRLNCSFKVVGPDGQCALLGQQHRSSVQVHFTMSSIVLSYLLIVILIKQNMASVIMQESRNNLPFHLTVP
jgi:hypothetical protein